MTLENKLIQISLSDQFLKNNKRIGLAVSGGIDSMVLLDLFRRLRDESYLDIFVLHYNHRWRRESKLDADFVKNYCKQNKIKFVYKETDGKVIKDEEVARNQRYSFYKEAARKYNLRIICTAHHKDDQIETILFRLARGTGPNGIMPVKELITFSEKTRIFRPLINNSKDEIKSYARKNNVTYRKDKTNDDLKYIRNYIRKKVLPPLKKINKKALDNVLRFSELVFAQSISINDYFAVLLKKISKDSFSWDKKRFLKLAPYHQKAFVYWFLSKYKIEGNIKKIDEVINTIKNQSSLDLDKNYYLIINKNKILFKQKKELNKNKIIHKPLIVDFSINGKKKYVNLRNGTFFSLERFNKDSFDDNFPQDKDNIAFVDLSRFKTKRLEIRYRKDGDVFQPLGFPIGIKLKKYLINKKIPKEKRYNLPLICLGKEVLWLPGYSINEKIKVLRRPTHIMRIEHEV